jgi:antitoxin HicB
MPISGKEVVRRLRALGWEVVGQRGWKQITQTRSASRDREAGGREDPVIQYQAKLHKEGSGYWLEFPDLPGCFTQGKSRAEALENAREALSLWLEEARDPHWDIPVPKARRGRQYVWVAPYEDVSIPLMIRQARQRKGLSQRELAKKLGMSVQQLQKLECPGKSNPTVRTLAAVSEALAEQLRIELVA